MQTFREMLAICDISDAYRVVSTDTKGITQTVISQRSSVYAV
jgi:hypothetical protein